MFIKFKIKFKQESIKIDMECEGTINLDHLVMLSIYKENCFLVIGIINQDVQRLYFDTPEITQKVYDAFEAVIFKIEDMVEIPGIGFVSNPN